MNEEELRNMMYSAALHNSAPYSIRYPRGNGVMVDWKKPFQIIETGKGRQVRKGKDLAIISIGHIGNEALIAAGNLSKQNIEVALFDLRFVKPLDESLLHIVFQNFDKVITVEDGCVQGGMGSAILEFMADNGYTSRVIRLGMPDKIIEHGTQQELWAECGYDAASIQKAVVSLVPVPVNVSY